MRLRQAIKKALKGVVAFLFDKAQNFDTRSRHTPFESQNTLDPEGVSSLILCFPKARSVFSSVPFQQDSNTHTPCGDVNISAFFFPQTSLLFNELMLLRPTKNCSFGTLGCSLVLRHLFLQSSLY